MLACKLSGQIRIDPVDDGAIYGLYPSPNSVSHSAYVLAAGYIRGAMLFESFDRASYDNISLALNPYGLPIWDPSIDVFGYSSKSSVISPDDYDKGVFVGTLNIPAMTGFGQDALLDVASFLISVDEPYFGFILRTDSGTDVFSSLEYNYGHPSGLVVTPSSVAVPEPSSGMFVLGSCGIVILAAYRKRRRRALT